MNKKNFKIELNIFENLRQTSIINGFNRLFNKTHKTNQRVRPLDTRYFKTKKPGVKSTC